jgi:sterol desaturase/sphingolipid hydroxylase (fatty acid hydroxylase superfamily)
MLIEVFQKFMLSVLILSPLELLLPRNKIAIFRKKRLLDLLYVFGAVFIISSITTGVIVVGVMILGPLVPSGLSAWLSGQHMIFQVIAIMIIADIGYYTLHRMHHEIPFLWKFHAVHHSIEELDWLAAYRTPPFDQSLTRGLSLAPVFALGFSTAAIGVWGFIFTWHSLLKHSNIKINFGPLRWVLLEPVFHHWHHANEEHAFDKNYAGQLPILDIIFGTAIMENRFGPSKYGTDTYVPDDFVGQLVHPIKSALIDDDEPSRAPLEADARA